MMYCMPQNDTTVSLYFPDDDEQNAYAINCIRRVPSPGVRLDPSTKSFITEDKKILLMAENAFHLFTMKCDALETTLSLIDTSGIRFDTSKNVKVTGNGIIFDAPDLKFKSDMQVQLISDQGIENDGKSECKVLITDNYIDYYGNSDGVEFIVRKHNNEAGYEIILDEPTEIADKDFDWGKLWTNVAIGLAIVAAVTCVCLCPIALGFVAAGTTAASVCTGAAIGAAVTGSFAVGMRACENRMNGKVIMI